jgi:hypothetical protein
LKSLLLAVSMMPFNMASSHTGKPGWLSSMTMDDHSTHVLASEDEVNRAPQMSSITMNYGMNSTPPLVSDNEEDKASPMSSMSSTTMIDDGATMPSAVEKEMHIDAHLVGWDGPFDKENPRNWSTPYKAWITFQLSMLALAASMGSSIIAPANKEIARYVGVSSEVAVLTVSLYV